MNKSQLNSTFTVSFLLFFLGTLIPTYASCSEEANRKSAASLQKSSFHIAIKTDGTSPLQKLTLTEEIYLQNQKRLDDMEPSHSEENRKYAAERRRFRDRMVRRNREPNLIRSVFDIDSLNKMLSVRDATGEKLPFEISENIDIEKELSKTLHLFPLYESRQLLDSTDTLLFKYNQQNQLQEVSTKKILKNKMVIGYLLDLGGSSNLANSELSFEFSKVSQTSFLRFNVDQSDDLKAWRRVSNNEVLAQLIEGDLSSQKDSIPLSNINSRFLRLTLLEPTSSFSIKSVIQNYSEHQPISPIWSDLWEFQWSQKEGGLILELSPIISYTAVKFDLENSPSLMSGNIFARTNSTSAWYRLKSFDIFHIKDGDRTVFNDHISLSEINASHLKITFDYPNNVNSDTPINLSLAWRPQQLTFFANGNAPYELVIDSDLNDIETTNSERLVSKIKAQLNAKIGTAELGESYLVTKPTQNKSYTYWPKTVLWLALLIGVFLMLWMVKRMFGQLK